MTKYHIFFGKGWALTVCIFLAEMILDYASISIIVTKNLWNIELNNYLENFFFFLIKKKLTGVNYR